MLVLRYYFGDMFLYLIIYNSCRKYYVIILFFHSNILGSIVNIKIILLVGLFFSAFLSTSAIGGHLYFKNSMPELYNPDKNYSGPRN